GARGSGLGVGPVAAAELGGEGVGLGERRVHRLQRAAQVAEAAEVVGGTRDLVLDRPGAGGDDGGGHGGGDDRDGPEEAHGPTLGAWREGISGAGDGRREGPRTTRRR